MEGRLIILQKEIGGKWEYKSSNDLMSLTVTYQRRYSMQNT